MIVLASRPSLKVCVFACVAIVAASAADQGLRGSVRLGAPITTIGEIDGVPEYTLSRVGGVQLLPGGVAVADNASAEVRIYDRSGRFLRRVGRRGRGPGEFLSLKLVPNWRSDSLVVYDQALGRVSFIGADGGMRSVRLPQAGVTTMMAGERDVLGVDRYGHLVLEIQDGASPKEPGSFRRVSHVVRLEPATSASQVVGTYKGKEMLFRIVKGNPTFSPLPFLQQFTATIGPDRLYYVEGPAGTAVEVAFNSSTRFEHRLAFSPRTISRAVFEQWFEEELLKVQVRARQATRQYYRSLYSPWSARPVSKLVVDDAGRLWVEEYTLADAKRVAVYSQQFELLGLLQLPPSFKLHSVRGNIVAGVVTTTEGVERVQLCPVIGL